MNNIFSYFSHDHDRLDRIYASFLTAFNSCRLAEARRYFDEFSEGLRLHIEWEEMQLFPLFEQQTGMVDSGPTFVMRKEHKIIEQLLLQVAEDLKFNAAECVENCRELSGLLKQHNLKEERVLYPAIDDLCSDLQVKTLLAQLS